MPLSLHILLCTISVLGLSRLAFAADTQAWKSRTIYQTMTDRFALTDGSTKDDCGTDEGLYCGGTWRGTINKLDYIQGMGFDAVMISPITENVEGFSPYGQAYHGYWQKDINSLNAHFGTHQDLLDLSDAVHKRGMYLMLDTVVNNMAYILNGSSFEDVDYSIYTPFDSSDYFHPYCQITDYNNLPLAQRCWTGDSNVTLPDLKTENSVVQDVLGNWIKKIISTYSIDGLRIDAAKHITPSFLPGFHEAANSSFMTGEVYQNDTKVICDYQENYIPSATNYPMYYSILQAFTRGNPGALAEQIDTMRQTCKDVTTLTSFSENADIARIASMVDMALAKNILTFTLLFDGVPIIYQGQEQYFKGAGDPANRSPLWRSSYNTDAPLYQLTAKLNKIRKHASKLDPDYLSTESYPVYVGGSEIAIRKGSENRQVIMVLSSQGLQGGKYDLQLKITYQPEMVVTDVLNCVNYTTNTNAELVIEMDKGEPRVLFPANMMDGSGLCGYPDGNVSYADLVEKTKSGASALGDGSPGIYRLVYFVAAAVGVIMWSW